MRRFTETFAAKQEIQKKYYETMQQQTQAEFLAYRSQINPHFLFNTLECIRSLAHTKRERTIEDLTVYMAQIFRYSLYAPSIVPLSQEIAHVKSYLNVLNIRFGRKYEFRLLVPSGLELTRLVPSMFLQPIVENSAKHAFIKNCNPKCIIALQVFEGADHCLIVRIADNGCGLSDSQQRQIQQNSVSYSPDRGGNGKEEGIGLANTFWRMRLAYGSNFKFRIKSILNHYTVIELTIPELPEDSGFIHHDGTPVG